VKRRVPFKEARKTTHKRIHEAIERKFKERNGKGEG